MGRTNARPQRRNFVVDPAPSCNKPLHEAAAKEEEAAEIMRKNIDDVYDEDDLVMSQAEETGSIPTTMGVRVAFLEPEGGEGDGGGDPSAGYPFF